jgi:hypothetical protein
MQVNEVGQDVETLSGWVTLSIFSSLQEHYACHRKTEKIRLLG